MKLILVFCALAALPQGAEAYSRGSVLEDLTGDGSHAKVTYGFWYSYWTPDFTFSQTETANVDIEPALLNQTSFSMQFGSDTNFLVQYVADEIIDSFEKKAEDRLGEDTVSAAKQILARLKQNIIEQNIFVIGQATSGEFAATAVSDTGVNAVLGSNDSSTGTFYKDVGISSWQSEYNEIEVNLGIGGPPPARGASGFYGFVLGLRILDYKRPLGFFYEPVVSEDPIITPKYSYLVLSDYNSAYVNFGFLADVYFDEYFLEGSYLFGVGGGSYSSDYFTDIDASGFYFDMNMKFGVEIIGGEYGGLTIFAGYRVFLNSTEGGEIVDTSENQKVTAKRNIDSNVPKGDQGRVYYSLLDIFHGPIFGATLRF